MIKGKQYNKWKSLAFYCSKQGHNQNVTFQNICFCNAYIYKTITSGLIHKLKSAGISGNLITWFTNYLTGRKQRVVMSGVQSAWNFISAGVPQGSILGPLLFLLFINNIVLDIGSSIRLFADDTSLYIIVEDPNVAAELLNADLEKIAEWALKWLVFMLDQQIKEVESH